MAIRIFINQSHNPIGHTIGAKGFGLRGQDLNYEIGTILADLLRADPRFEVRVSRGTANTILGTDNSSSLVARVNAANSWPADYFISIHGNANINPNINGTEVYVYRENTQAYWLAHHVLHGIINQTGTQDNGVRLNPGLYVLQRTRMPSILVETAYLTNAQDAERLRSNPRGFAQGIYNGLLGYFGLV